MAARRRIERLAWMVGDGRRYRFVGLSLAMLSWALAAGCARSFVGTITTARSPAPPAAAPAHEGRSVRPPILRTVRVGESVEGVPLVLEIFGDGPDKVFLLGGIHGSEGTSAGLARFFSTYVRQHPELSLGRTIAILAAANPDGLARERRANARGVDLNRNFPARSWRKAGGRGVRHGATPGSEPETRAIMTAVEVVQPQRALAIHSIARGRHCNNYDGPGESLTRLMSHHNGYPVQPSMGYPTPGSFGSWMGVDQRVPTVTLELPRDLNDAECWRENQEALLAFVRGDSQHGEPSDTAGR